MQEKKYARKYIGKERSTPENVGNERRREKDVRNAKMAGQAKDEKPSWLAGRSPFWITLNENLVMTGSSGPPKTSGNSPIRKKTPGKERRRKRKTPEKDAAKERRGKRKTPEKTPKMKDGE